MRGLGFLFGFFLLLFTASPVKAESEFQQESEQWSHLVTSIVEQVEEKEYLKAREGLERLSAHFSQSRFADKHISVEGIHVLSETILDLEKRLTQIRPDPSSANLAALRLQLAFDSVNHSHQPLWKDFYDVLKKDITSVQTALDKKKPEQVTQALQKFSHDYHLVRPALVIVKRSITVQKLDSLLAFITKQKDLERISNGIHQFENLLDPLFFGSEKDVMLWMDANSPISMSAYLYVIVAVLLTTLVYILWQRPLWN